MLLTLFGLATLAALAACGYGILHTLRHWGATEDREED